MITRLTFAAAVCSASLAFAGQNDGPLHPGYEHHGGSNGNEGRGSANAQSRANASATATSHGGAGGAGGHGGSGGAVTFATGAIGGGNGGAGGNAAGGSATGGAGGSATGGSATGGDGGNQWQTVDNSGNSSNSGNNTGTSNVSISQNYEAKRIPVSTAYAPALTSGIDTCLGSFSAGAQHTVFGISFGKTTVDENCVMLKQARMLHEMGLRVAAWQRMCQSPDTRAALIDSGSYDCRSTAAQLAQIENDKQAVILAEEKRKRDEETLREAERIVIEKQVREEIAANQPKVKEFGRPTYVEPQACKPVAKGKKKPAKRKHPKDC